MAERCARCRGPMLEELDDAIGEPVQFCLACGERIWARSTVADDTPRRATTRARPVETSGLHPGRRLFDAAQVAAIEAALDAGVPLERVARRFGCAYETVRRIRAGQYN